MATAAPTRGAARVLRCGAVGLCTGLLAVLAHATGGGHVPSLPHVLVFALAMAWTCVPLADRQLGFVDLLGLVGVVQVAAHVFLGVLSRHPREVLPSPSMLLTHLVATAIVVAALAGFEQAVFRLAAALAAVLPRPLCPRPAFAPLRIPIAAHPPQPLSEVLRRRTLPRRGPPNS
ncbi:hypothetical protein B0I31_101753 [Saccharothrix carnea]|uniref:Uncharacterized protein n=1 Tax=Saccharothrix carnea TaxID=1280637 RepID=A0A2P8IJ74_SACCR|nr:hypothetical protein [Saccharothrix carnea]PSL58534.1 hypothetical protein B0I31_101753 [Saccharothrix carnea]